MNKMKLSAIKINTITANCVFSLTLYLSLPFCANSQKTVVTDSSDAFHKTVIAGNEYKTGFIHRMLLGSHYRKEWKKPVSVPVINLDSVAGGLTPTTQGGGRQTQTLRLKSSNGKEYVLRSIDKDYGGALPDIVRGTFIERLAKDQVTTTHPYAALTIPAMAEAAGVYHTNPKIVFVPYSNSLGAYNQTFGNTLCLFEERPDDIQEDVASFGSSKKVVSTGKMFEKIFEENDHRVDQKAFVKARLFDMFIGDWGRHDDQWRWASFKEEGQTIYKPIPRDRDQAYAKFDGFFPYLFTSPEELEHLKSFKGHIKNIKKFNFPARYLDRQLANEVTEHTWTDIAKELQQSLTDKVIEDAIRQLPPEVFAVSGNVIIRKLKSRRSLLPGYARKYYNFLSEEVDVVGTKESELFEVNRLARGETQITLYDLDKEGKPKNKPFYSRTFHRKETHEIRLYGLEGNDRYHIEGNGKHNIAVRIIGGRDKDSLTNESTATAGKIRYYDNKDNSITGRVNKHLSDDSSINAYNYRAFKYNTGHTIKMPFYSNTRGIHLLFGYTYARQHWRKEPYGWQQSLKFIYSITNSAVGGEYEGLFNKALGNWNLALNARYDAVLKNNFFGIGNESKMVNKLTYYRLLTEEGFGSIGINRNFAGHHHLNFTGFYHSVKVDDDKDRFVAQLYPSYVSFFERKHFAGAEATYVYHHLNDEVVPSKGIYFSATANYTQNLKQTDRAMQRYLATFGFYLPFSKSLSLSVKANGASVTGDPEIYLLNWIGGGQNLRGFRRQRFYGKTAFVNNNELRWIRDTRNYFFSGKIGLIAFLDNGRVWQPGETSNTWHAGYGGGVLLAPFNKLSLGVYYGISKESKLFSLRFGKSF
jgi:hypothetical protein